MDEDGESRVKRRVKGLYAKIMLPVGSIFAVVTIAALAFTYVSGVRRTEQVWLARVETLNGVAFEALYASMHAAGSRQDSSEVVARLRDLGMFSDVHVVKGDAVVSQFGARAGELAQDDLDRQALRGTGVGQVRRDDGYDVVRYVTPLRAEAECQLCHQVAVGTVLGAISSEMPLSGSELAFEWQRNEMLVALAAGLLVLGVLTFYALQRLVIRPLRAIERGTAAIARGDLDHRLEVNTGDEMEVLATGFNRMAEQLLVSYGQVEEERSKVVAAIEASSDAIWVSDAGQRLVMVNSALERLVGQGRDALLGRSCYDLICLLDGEETSICDTSCAFLHPEARGGRLEGCIAAARGEGVWVEVSYGCVFDAAGRLAGVVHIARDLTERREVERMKDAFISMVSHELRTPLTHIKGFATSLLQTDVEWDVETQRDFLGSINREADRLTNLVQKMLDLSSLESSRLPMEKDWYEVDQLVDGALQRRRRLIDGRPVKLCLDHDLPALFVDGREIEIVLTNLLENAVKYSEAGTLITLSAERRDREVVLSVADEGPGIAAEQQTRIFERFYRVPVPGHRREDGAGLGLAICKHIVEAHRGEIWVESTVGAGSSFRFSLPLDAEDGSARLAQRLPPAGSAPEVEGCAEVGVKPGE